MDLQDQIKVSLEESQLWEKFAVLTNEMIVTKNGRRMFPVIKLNLSGLEPNTLYKVWLEFRQIENNRYKYINGEWHPGNLHLKYYLKFHVCLSIRPPVIPLVFP